jgi:hypothetical protein
MPKRWQPDRPHYRRELPLVQRLFNQIERVLEINQLRMISVAASLAAAVCRRPRSMSSGRPR